MAAGGRKTIGIGPNTTFDNAARSQGTPSRESRGRGPPAPHYQQESSIDEDLLKSLRLLQRYQKLELIKRKPTSKKGTSGAAVAVTPYNFTTHMFFRRSNTEALIQVTYQILSTVFPDECDLRFRTCWPIDFDRKLESEYRKAAFTWVLEISEKYPQFFEGKPQFSYFVSPLGFKCVRFLAGFADCGLYILAERIQAKRGETIIDVNPALCDDPEEAEDRLTQIKLAHGANIDKCTKLLKDTACFEIYKEQLKSKQEEGEAADAQYLVEQEAKIREHIQQRPELFPEDAQSLLHSSSRSRFSVSDGRTFDAKMLLVGSITKVEDKLGQFLTEEWKRKLMLVGEMYEKVREFLIDNRNFVDLLHQIGDNIHITIDTKNYPTTFKANGKDLPDVGEFILQIPALFEEIQKIFPSGDILVQRMPQLLTTVKQITDTKLKLKAEATTTVDSVKPKVNMEDLLFALKVEQMALEGTDWNKFLPETSSRNTMDVDRALTLTPSKPLDFVRTTGLTPNFDCGIQMSSTPEPKINRLMNSIRISASASGSGIENDRVTTLRNGEGVRRNLVGKGVLEVEDPILDLHLDGGYGEDEGVFPIPNMQLNGSDNEFERGIMDDTSFMPTLYTSPDTSSS